MLCIGRYLLINKYKVIFLDIIWEKQYTMKICIITCHDVYNFGASLQAYALQHYLEELGHEVEIIDYRPGYLYKKYDWKSFTSKKFDKLNSFFVTRWMFRIAKWSYLRFSLGRKKCFDEFTKNYLKLTDKTYYTFEELKMNPPCADIIIAGSDQIWNPLFPNGKDPSYYIDFALSQTKRVSYAASFSVEYISDADKEFVKGMLAKMNRISVREYQGVDILKSLDIKNGVKVLDPVFLLDRNYWETFMHKGSEKDYILIYDFEGSDLMKRVALYFNKPFYVFGLKGISLNSRMESLLRSVDLKDRFITENIDIEKLHLNYDFNKVNLLIEEEKNYSKQFLDSVLKTN